MLYSEAAVHHRFISNCKLNTSAVMQSEDAHVISTLYLACIQSYMYIFSVV